MAAVECSRNFALNTAAAICSASHVVSANHNLISAGAFAQPQGRLIFSTHILQQSQSTKNITGLFLVGATATGAASVFKAFRQDLAFGAAITETQPLVAGTWFYGCPTSKALACEVYSLGHHLAVAGGHAPRAGTRWSTPIL